MNERHIPASDRICHVLPVFLTECRVRYILKLVFTIAVVMTLTSCKGTQPEGYYQDSTFIKNENPTAVVVILGRHANAMEIPDDAYKTVDSLLEQAVYGGYACVIISDGKPSAINLADQDYFKECARNTTVLNKLIKTHTEELSARIRDPGVLATDPENDLLAAFREASHVFADSDVKEIKDKQIVVIDSGVTTTGDLSFFQLDLLNNRLPAAEIIRQLENADGINLLPDLTGINITFVGTADGMAEVAEPQELATADKIYIRDCWSDIVKACGAGSVQFESAAGWSQANVYTDNDDSVFPFVSTVPFEYKPVIAVAGTSSQTTDQSGGPASSVINVRLGSEVVGFLPNTAEFQNDLNTRELFKPYAEEIKQFTTAYPDEKIWIIGTTTTYTQRGEGDIGLGLMRADKVKQTLVEEGIPEERLLTIGLGAQFPWRIDEFQNGEVVEELAQQNRAVWLLTDNDDNDRFAMLTEAYNNGRLAPEAALRFEQNLLK